MLHISTRGDAPSLSFADALLAGLARDGGLYVPKALPRFSTAEIAGLAGKPYAAVAEQVVGALADGDVESGALKAMIGEAYASFRHPAVCPLVQLGDNLFSLELFHGPTLAFKDVAMQLLGRLMDHVLAQRGERATIVGATSGDTGGAAIDAFKGLERVDIFILYPEGDLGVRQARHGGQVVVGELRHGFRHVEAAVAGHAGEHVLLEGERGRLPAGADVAHELFLLVQ